MILTHTDDPHRISYNARPPDTDSGQEYNPRLFLGPGYSGLFWQTPPSWGIALVIAITGFVIALVICVQAGVS